METKRIECFRYDALTLLSSTGVLTTSGSASILLGVTTSCLFRPLRLGFFWVSLVMSAESLKKKRKTANESGNNTNCKYN